MIGVEKRVLKEIHRSLGVFKLRNVDEPTLSSSLRSVGFSVRVRPGVTQKGRHAYLVCILTTYEAVKRILSVRNSVSHAPRGALADVFQESPLKQLLE